MYCTHCGKQIPDNAMYCSHCGTVVIKNPQQPPVYTPPASQQPPAYTPPAPQQPPVYTPPVNDPQNAGTYTPPVKPLEEVYGYVPPVQEPAKEPVYVPPVQEAPVYTTQATDREDPVIPPVQHQFTPAADAAPEHKRIRKLPILLGMLAVVLVLVLAVSLGGGSDDGVRIKNGKFTFTTSQMEEWYAADLEANNIPLSWKGNTTYYSMYCKGEKVGHFWLYHDAKNSSNKVTSINLELPNTDEYVPWMETSIRCLLKQCHGAMTEEMLDTFLSTAVITQELSRNGSGESYEVLTCRGYGLELEIWALEETYAASFRPMEGDPLEAPESGKGVENAQSDAPLTSGFAQNETRLRFDSTGFLFGAEEFETYFRDGMELTEIPFVLDEPAPVGDNKYNYHVLYSGKQVGYLIFTFDPATGKAVDISLTYNYQSNEKVDEYGTYAAIAMIPICHGAVTDEQFDALGATEPTVNREDYILYDYRLDGMRTMLVFEPDQIFVNVTIP